MVMHKRNTELSFGYILNMFCLIFYSHSSMLFFSLFDEIYQDKSETIKTMRVLHVDSGG